MEETKYYNGNLLQDVIELLDDLQRLPTNIDYDCSWIIEDAIKLKKALIERFPEYELQ